MPDLKNCPFCGGRGVLQGNPGSWGYTPPTVWVQCENSIFPKTNCAAETRHLPTEEWKQGKGTYSVTQTATASVIGMWNQRAN